MTQTELKREHNPCLKPGHSSMLSKIQEQESQVPEYGGDSGSHPLG